MLCIAVGNRECVTGNILWSDCGVKLRVADDGVCLCVPDNGRRNQSSDND